MSKTLTKEQELHKPPFYYVKKRLLANKPAILGMVMIIISVVIAILGYAIMPDNTPNADNQIIQIQKQPPGFSVKLMKVRLNMPIEESNFFEMIIFGRKTIYKYIPIENDYRIDGVNVYVKPFNGKGTEQAYPIIDAVAQIYDLGTTDKFEADPSGNFKLEGENLIYLDLDENIQTISKTELIETFEKQHFETRTYWFGTDEKGRDVLSRIIFGFRISLGIGLVSVFISLIVGVSLGAIAGFFGGFIDILIVWFMTVVWSIPNIMLVIAISLALHGRGIWVVFFAVGLTSWVEIARVVRGQILSIKEKQFIEAARALGISSFRIIYVHILPNLLGPIIVIMTSNFASAILTEAGLSFLGLGVVPPMPSWGQMVKAEDITNNFYLAFFPSLFISIMVLAFNLFGNGLRDAYDPKTNTTK